ncbi:hypothetical protein MD484_g5624, partial [Candolleomyces efflorescens]
MGKRWADTPQWDWLTARVPEYKKAAAAGQKRQFCQDATKALISEFKIEPTEEAIKVLGGKVANQALYDLYSSRVENWFPNATRVTTTASVASKRGTLEPKKKMLQHWQVYQKLYWEKGLEERANNECKRLHGVRLSQLDPQKRFAVRNRIILELYKGESEEVQRIVNEAREGRRTDPLTNEDIVRNLSKLPRTLKQFGENIVSKTDWSGVLAFGGPHPSYDGKIYTFIRPVGTTKEGLTFDEFLGKEAYMEWVGQLDAFFDACYDDDDRAGRVTGAAPRAGDASGVNNENPRPSSSKPAPKESVSNMQERDSGSPPKSEYERTREINMARNKIVLGILDKTIDSGEEPEVLVEELKKVGVELDATELKMTLEKIKAFCTPNNQPEAGDAPPTQPVPPTSESAAPTPEGNNGLAPAVSEELPNTISTPAGTAPPPVNDIPMDDSKCQQQDVATLNGQEDLAGSRASNLKDSGASEGNGGHQIETETVVDGKAAGHVTVYKDASALAGLEAVLPAYLKAVWKYLLSVSQADAWCTLLYHFVLFEAHGESNGRLRMNTADRPKAVQAWIKSHKKTSPPSLDLATFPIQTQSWWKANQPEWRIEGVDTVSPSTFKREIPSDADWTALARSGTTGIYTVVMAVSWWILKADVKWAQDLVDLVDDITWVLKEMAPTGEVPDIAPSDKEVEASGSPKRVLDEDSDAPVTASGRQVKRPRRLQDL